MKMCDYSFIAQIAVCQTMQQAEQIIQSRGCVPIVVREVDDTDGSDVWYRDPIEDPFIYFRLFSKGKEKVGGWSFERGWAILWEPK